MKDRLHGCAILLFFGALVFAWWLPKTHTAFWSILIGGIVLWIGGIYLKVIYTRPDTTLGSARFGGRAGGDDSENALALWKRRGKRAFDAEAAETASSDDAPGGEN